MLAPRVDPHAARDPCAVPTTSSGAATRRMPRSRATAGMALSNVCSIMVGTCASRTARSRAGAPSTGSRACRSPGRSTRTRAAPTAAPSATSAASRHGRIGPRTIATAARSASRSTSPTCCGASSREGRGGARRSSSALPPTRTSPWRAATGSHVRASSPWPTARDAVLDHHPRAADLARRRRAAGSCRSHQGRDLVLRAHARRPGLAHDRARHRPAAPATRVVRRLADAGIDVGVALAPLLPGISDRPEQLGEVVRAARDAGARSIWAALLNLRPGTREHFLEALARDWPEQLQPTRSCTRAGPTSLPRATQPTLQGCAGSPGARRAASRRRCARRPNRSSSCSPSPPRRRIARVADAPEIATQPRSPSCSPTTTRSCARACDCRCSARRTSASWGRRPTARRRSRWRSVAAPTS